MKVFKTLTQKSPLDFTPWTTPRTQYMLACCDCGLVHDLELRVVVKGGKILDRRKAQIQFRLRRNIKSTAALRREDAKKAAKKQ